MKWICTSCTDGNHLRCEGSITGLDPHDYEECACTECESDTIAEKIDRASPEGSR